MKQLNIGDTIKDFTLQDQSGNKVSLSDYKGQKVLVSFHPLAFTSVCTDQMRALERNYDQFKAANIEVLGISVDSVPAKKAWAAMINIDKMKILSDFNPFAEVAKQFGTVSEELNTSGRANFLIDEAGKLEWKRIYKLPELPDIHELLAFTDTQ